MIAHLNGPHLHIYNTKRSLIITPDLYISRWTDDGSTDKDLEYLAVMRRKPLHPLDLPGIQIGSYRIGRCIHVRLMHARFSRMTSFALMRDEHRWTEI